MGSLPVVFSLALTMTVAFNSWISDPAVLPLIPYNIYGITYRMLHTDFYTTIEYIKNSLWRTAVESQDQRKAQSPISRPSYFTSNQLTVEDATPTRKRKSSAKGRNSVRNSVRKSTGHRQSTMGGRKASGRTTEEFDIDKSLKELQEKIKELESKDKSESEDKNDITYGSNNLWLYNLCIFSMFLLCRI